MKGFRLKKKSPLLPEDRKDAGLQGAAPGPEEAGGKPLWQRIYGVLRGLGLTLLILICVGVFCVAVILGEPPELSLGDEEETTAAEVLLSLPGGGSAQSTETQVLAPYFPGPLAQISPGSGIALSQGTAQDLRVSGVTCRMVTLRYDISGQTVLLRSGTPGQALLYYADGEMQISPTATALGPLAAIALTLDDRQILLARQGEWVYALEAPASFPSLPQLSTWVVFE